MLLLYFLVKLYWSLFIDITKTTRTVEGELEKGVHAGIKQAKPERGDHMAPTKQHLSKIWIRCSLDCWTAAPNPKALPKTHKSHFIIFTLENDLTAELDLHPETQILSGRCSLPSYGGTYLGWPEMWPLLTGRGGRARGSECPTGASSQTHAQRQASKLKDMVETAGYATVSYTVSYIVRPQD